MEMGINEAGALLGRMGLMNVQRSNVMMKRKQNHKAEEVVGKESDHFCKHTTN